MDIGLKFIDEFLVMGEMSLYEFNEENTNIEIAKSPNGFKVKVNGEPTLDPIYILQIIEHILDKEILLAEYAFGNSFGNGGFY